MAYQIRYEDHPCIKDGKPSVGVMIGRSNIEVYLCEFHWGIFYQRFFVLPLLTSKHNQHINKSN